MEDNKVVLGLGDVEVEVTQEELDTILDEMREMNRQKMRSLKQGAVEFSKMFGTLPGGLPEGMNEILDILKDPNTSDDIFDVIKKIK